jgi:hypothetical protein
MQSSPALLKIELSGRSSLWCSCPRENRRQSRSDSRMASGPLSWRRSIRLTKLSSREKVSAGRNRVWQVMDYRRTQGCNVFLLRATS